MTWSGRCVSIPKGYSCASAGASMAGSSSYSGGKYRFARALAAGAALESDVSEHAYGRLALLSDPFGHGFCLLQFTGRGYDELPST